MSTKKKYYVVWEGRHPGVYDDWNDTLEQIDGFPNARYKGFSSAEAATEAYRRGTAAAEGDELARLVTAPETRKDIPDSDLRYLSIPEVDKTAWAVDASCLGNPGVMEYRGVDLATGETVFRVGPFEDATNNIGEFLAIVHAMALMQQRGVWHNIYSDSVSGMAWVRNRKIKTQLTETPRNAKLFDLMRRAMSWLNTHHPSCKVIKWQTFLWGEIPADFGRK